LFHNTLHKQQQQAMAEVIIVAAALVAAFGCVGAGFYGVANTVNSTKKHFRTRKVLHTGIRYKQPATAAAGDRSRACSCEEVVSLKKRCKRKLKKSSVTKDVRVFSDGHVEAHGLISYPTTECSICLDECKVRASSHALIAYIASLPGGSSEFNLVIIFSCAALLS
jgi:hypothetical protein